MRSITILTSALVATLCSGVIEAQVPTKNELTVFGGLSLIDVTATSDRTLTRRDGGLVPLIFPAPIIERSTTFDGGAEFGARYSRDLTGRLALIADFSLVPGHEVTVHTLSCAVCIATPALNLIAPDVRLSERVAGYHYGGGLRLSLPGMNLDPGRLIPSVLAGIGGVTYATDRRSESDVTFRAGAALTASFRSVTAGVEVVDVIVSDHFLTDSTEQDVHFRLTFGVRF